MTFMEEYSQIEDNGIHQLAQSLVELHDEALMLYTPLVNDMCARKASEDELEELLSSMLGFVTDERILALFKKVCRIYFYTYPEAVGFYVKECMTMMDENKAEDV